MVEKKEEKQSIVFDAVLFDLILLGGFLVLTIVSFNYNPRARSIPLVLGIIGSVMIFLQFLIDAFPKLRRKLRFVSESGLLAEQSRFSDSASKAPDRSEPHRTEPVTSKKTGGLIKEWWRVLRVVLWICGFILLLSKTHYLIAVGLFVVLVTKIEAGESWTRSLVLAACVDTGFFILFDLILKVQL
jgi:hypothetical protein